MGEIRLICPGCRVEYRLPQDAIPTAGREVECTACGQVWFASATSGTDEATSDAAPQATPRKAGTANSVADPKPQPDRDPAAGPEADARPAAPSLAPLSQRLPESVLNILRDEVEHERRAKKAEDDALGRTPPHRQAEIDWPATTITGDAEGDGRGSDDARDRTDDRARPRAPAAPDTSAQPANITDLGQPLPRPEMDAQPVAEPLDTEITSPQDLPASRMPLATASADGGATALPGATTERRSHVEGASAYGIGLGVAAMASAACLALYVMAPGLADAGPVGDTLIGLRQIVDEGRMWLQSLVDAQPG